jgi:hypothetical protein
MSQRTHEDDLIGDFARRAGNGRIRPGTLKAFSMIIPDVSDDADAGYTNRA